MIQLTGLTTTAITLAVWNIVSALLEYILMLSIFNEYPQLLKSRKVTADRNEADSLVTKIRGMWLGWKLYMTNPTRNAGLGLAFLWMTVLSLSSILWAYSLLQCVQEYVLSILVGVAALNGIMGSLAFPFFRKHFGVKGAGLVGELCLLAALTICVIAVFLPGSQWRISSPQGEVSREVCPKQTSIYVLLVGVVASRFGLWLSDIAITQIQQQEVEEEIRGQIGGVQGSLNSTLDLVKYVLVLLLPKASDFGYLVFCSFFSISCGAIFYSTYAVPTCFQNKKSRNVIASEVTPLLESNPALSGNTPQQTAA